MSHLQKRPVLLGAVLLYALLIGLWYSTRAALVESRETNMTLTSEIELLGDQVETLRQSLDVMRIDLVLSQEDLYSHLYPDAALDTVGNTPADVVRDFIQAGQRKDWQAAYECLTMIPEDLSATKYAEEMESAKGEIVHFSIDSYQVRAEDRARVLLSYRYRFEGGTERTFEYEPWGVIRSDGVWKVKWLPRQ